MPVSFPTLWNWHLASVISHPVELASCQCHFPPCGTGILPVSFPRFKGRTGILPVSFPTLWNWHLASFISPPVELASCQFH
ncbi:MAG: hypothetical protein F6K26_55465 [Moorea sp. SIO2I5]|nr:hypothetical protein [Moorena sp. SIO2I5]